MRFENIETPVDRAAGLSSRRERRWGLVGGLLGSLFGAGAAVVAVFLDGASWYESGPYPAIFRREEILALDLYLLLMLLIGIGFAACGLVLARRSPFPRSEAYGAGLVGALLLSLSGLIFFIRVVALTRGA